MSCVPNNPDVACSFKQTEQCIQKVNLWMRANNLKLNGDKNKLLIIGTQQQCCKVSNSTINVADNSIGLSEKGKHLGFLFDRHLNLKSHVNMICNDNHNDNHNDTNCIR